MSRTPQTSTVIKDAIAGVLLGVNTALPGIVTRYDATAKRVDIQPAIKMRDAQGVKSRAQILGVPVLFPSSGGFHMTMPVAVGDEMLCIFSQRSLDRWRKTGGEVDPLDGRKFDASDALAIPAGMSEARAVAALADVAFFGLDSNASGFKVHGDGKIAIGTGAADLLAIVDDLSDATKGLVNTLTTAIIIPGAVPGTFAFDPTTIAAIQVHGATITAIQATLSTIRAA